jgi:hypothetical protein
MRLLRRALESHAKATEDREELAKINALQTSPGEENRPSGCFNQRPGGQISMAASLEHGQIFMATQKATGQIL